MMFLIYCSYHLILYLLFGNISKDSAVFQNPLIRIPELDPLWVSVFVTGVLVVITGLYLWETRKIRLESIRPNFSLRTGLYTIGGGMHELYLRNTGRVARDLEVDVKTSTKEDKLFFVPSLDSGQEIRLDVDFQQIKENNGYVKIELKFKDGYNRECTDSLSVNFEQLSKEGREITFQLSPKDRNIEKIADNLEQIERDLHK